MKPRKKINNNLIAIKYDNGDILYYTSYCRAGSKVGIQASSAKWACEHGNKLVDYNDRELIFELVDGSNIPYKYINN